MAIPATTGTNCWTQAEDLMVTVLTGCSSLLPFLGVADVPAALAGNMYLDSMGRQPEEFADADWIAKFPSVIIGTPGSEAGAFSLRSVATGPAFNATGVIEVIFSVLVNSVDPIEEQERDFKNSVGLIMEEMTYQLMAMQDITVQQYGRAEPDDVERLGEILGCWIQVPWGTEVEDES